MSIKLIPFAIIALIAILCWKIFSGSSIHGIAFITITFCVHVGFQYWVRGNGDLMARVTSEEIEHRLDITTYNIITTILLMIFIFSIVTFN